MRKSVALGVGTLALAALALVAQAGAQSYLVQERLVSYGGEAVAVRGRFMLIGDVGAGRAGAVHVYRNSLRGWLYETKLLPANLAAGEQFGYAVATDSKTVAVAMGVTGAPRVSLYQRTQGRNSRGPHGPQGQPNEQGWTEVARLQLEAPVGTRLALDISGRTLLVGVPGEPSGYVHVYRYRRQVWSHEAELRAPDAPDGFGAHVAAANASRAVIGSREEAVIYHRNGPRNGWSETARLSFRGQGDLVAAEDATVVLGADPDQRVRVFRLIDDLWTTVATLHGTDVSDGDGFGKSVGFSDGIVAVGAPQHQGARGAVYLFAETPAGWVEQTKLMATDASAAFGAALSLHQGTLTVGSEGTGAWCFE